jgi:putative Holliday junction resolvase
MGRLIGIDYGQKRTGLAVTDPGQLIATVLTTISSYDVLDYLQSYLAKEQVDGFVVGFPRKLDFSPSQSAVYVQAFVKGLSRRFPEIPVHWMDERFTSSMALQTMVDAGSKKSDRRDKSNVDAISAAIILESFLQKLKIERDRHP